MPGEHSAETTFVAPGGQSDDSPERDEGWALATSVAALARMPDHEVQRFPSAKTRAIIEITSLEAGSPWRTGDGQLGKLSRPLWSKGFSAAESVAPFEGALCTHTEKRARGHAR